MADLSDVSDALVALIASTLYPNGTGGGQNSVAGLPCRIYAGWPTPAQLDADLAAGTAHVTVFNRPEAKNTTRYQTVPQEQTTTPPALTLTINGRTVTVGGAVAAGVNTAVIVGTKGYVYQTLGTDTLNSVATTLAGLINADFPGTTATGAVITLPSAGPAITAARVGGSGQQVTEVGRIEQSFQITIWANTPANRKAIASLVAPTLMNSRFITLADGSAARLIVKRQCDDDMRQKAVLYRRDIVATIEYAETLTTTSTAVVDIVENISVGVNGYNGTTNSQLYPNTTTTNI
ncbi:hypothetical protein ACUXAV_000652 [Cupriavidus metallidurans]|jgi:hypothetical protein|uniref:Uncharacterized protein n=1 Tax=Cupriavidus metallidurans TaxID=119219 RepID=A0A482IQT1_9BURK|nr:MULTISPECIES: hypothetical protein [Cupriavidus]KWR79035.1 hypothetical protein RN01_22590 [Cupriavidus sp. SHE]MDE4918553.1 hypothetical protein [Cupriavidus metallidurans]QBP09374.1 hypothetical protein DDF84_006190 [Cupriavidus metallidurans]